MLEAGCEENEWKRVKKNWGKEFGEGVRIVEREVGDDGSISLVFREEIFNTKELCSLVGIALGSMFW
jgi:hypothetical protein